MVGWHHRLHGDEFHQELVVDREACHAVVCGVTKSQARLSNWTELNWTDALPISYHFNETIVSLCTNSRISRLGWFCNGCFKTELPHIFFSGIHCRNSGLLILVTLGLAGPRSPEVSWLQVILFQSFSVWTKVWKRLENTVVCILALCFFSWITKVQWPIY